MVAALVCGSFVRIMLPATVEPVNVKIVKTDSAFRGKPWSYRVISTQKPNPSYKNIRRDDTISFTPGTNAELEVCTETGGKGACQKNSLENKGQEIVYAAGKQIAIDGSGNALARTSSEIQALINKAKPTRKIAVEKEAGSNSKSWTVEAVHQQDPNDPKKNIKYGTVKVKDSVAAIRGLDVPQDRAFYIIVKGTGVEFLKPQEITLDNAKNLKRLVLNQRGNVMMELSTITK